MGQFGDVAHFLRYGSDCDESGSSSGGEESTESTIGGRLRARQRAGLLAAIEVRAAERQAGKATARDPGRRVRKRVERGLRRYLRRVGKSSTGRGTDTSDQDGDGSATQRALRRLRRLQAEAERLSRARDPGASCRSDRPRARGGRIAPLPAGDREEQLKQRQR